MIQNKSGLVILLLSLSVIVLLGFVIYAFGIKPAISGYVTSAQNQGVEFAVVSIMQQVASCHQVPLTFGNQTINLIVVECLQVPTE